MCNTNQNKSPTHCMRLLTFALCTVYPQILAQSENTYGNRSKRIHICNNVDASLYSFIHFSALTILTINFSSVFSELQTDIINTFLKKLSRKRSDRLVIYINWSFWKKKNIKNFYPVWMNRVMYICGQLEIIYRNATHTDHFICSCEFGQCSTVYHIHKTYGRRCRRCCLRMYSHSIHSYAGF